MVAELRRRCVMQLIIVEPRRKVLQACPPELRDSGIRPRDLNLSLFVSQCMAGPIHRFLYSTWARIHLLARVPISSLSFSLSPFSFLHSNSVLMMQFSNKVRMVQAMFGPLNCDAEQIHQHLLM